MVTSLDLMVTFSWAVISNQLRFIALGLVYIRKVWLVTQTQLLAWHMKVCSCLQVQMISLFELGTWEENLKIGLLLALLAVIVHVSILKNQLTSFFIADGAIQDLLFLPNGLLLSCSYDKTIIAWQYKDNSMVGEPIVRKDELRCMGLVEKHGPEKSQDTLLIGTNSHAILTQDIRELLAH